MLNKSRPKIAICFFGITRSLTYTIDSINEQVIKPAKHIGNVEIFAHFFKQANIDNPRSGEKMSLPTNEHSLLKPDFLQLEEPDFCLEKYDFENLKLFGDFWKDDFYSLRNLIHQLHSLKNVTNIALKSNADIYIFVRPDLKYHNSFNRLLKRASHLQSFTFIPNWQHWEGGYNDRFAICDQKTAQKYGNRIDRAGQFCQTFDRPLHSENLLKYSLLTEKIYFTNLKASRIRADGTQKKEKFLNFKLKKFKRWLPLKKKIALYDVK